MTRPKYRDCLPQCLGGMFLTDGGMETSLIWTTRASTYRELRRFHIA